MVLACTHYPLLLPWFERLSPWPVAYVDSAPAIARRVDAVLVRRGLVSQDEERRRVVLCSPRVRLPVRRWQGALARLSLVTLRHP